MLVVLTVSTVWLPSGCFVVVSLVVELDVAPVSVVVLDCVRVVVDERGGGGFEPHAPHAARLSTSVPIVKKRAEVFMATD